MFEAHLDTLLGSSVATALNVNGLLVPARSLGSVLFRYSAPALFFQEDLADYSLSKAGTMFRARLRDRWFSLVTRHQFGPSEVAYDFDMLCMPGIQPGTLYTSHRLIFSGSERGENELDMYLFEFTDVVASGKVSTAFWFDLEQDLANQERASPSKLCALGYPGVRNFINYDEKEYKQAPNAVWGSPCQSMMADRSSFRVEPVLDFDPDGMSGSPVFGITIDNLEPRVVFSGLLTNASRATFNYIPLQSMAFMLDELFR